MNVRPCNPAGGLAVLLVSVAILAGCGGVAPSGSPSPAAAPTQVIWPLPSGSSAEQYLQAGVALGDQSRWDEAVEACTKAIELDPTLAWAYYSRGLAYAKQGRLDLAVADFTRSIELARSNAAYYERGRAFFREGKLDLAIADFTKAIELDPTDASAYAWRGVARAKIGDKAGAILDFDKALSLATDPDTVSTIKQMRCAVGLGCE